MTDAIVLQNLLLFLNALFVDNEHRRIFKDRIFASFRRAKNFKDTLVRAKVYQLTDEKAEKGTFNQWQEKLSNLCTHRRAILFSIQNSCLR